MQQFNIAQGQREDTSSPLIDILYLQNYNFIINQLISWEKFEYKFFVQDDIPNESSYYCAESFRFDLASSLERVEVTFF